MADRSRKRGSRSRAAESQPTVKHSSRRGFLRRAIGAAVVGTGAILYGHDIGGNGLEVSRTRLAIPAWPDNAPPLRIGFLSDLHCDSAPAVERARRAVGMLLDERPDVVLFGGDYITWNALEWIDPMAEAIAPATTVPGGAFGVLGNHDWWSLHHERIQNRLGAVGIRILSNESAQIPKIDPRIWLVGIEDMSAHRANGPRALSSVPPDAVKIALVHEPDWADTAPADSKFALQLSGHSHAGQVRIFGRPIYCPPLGRKYPQGLEQSLKHLVYTTRGVGMMSPQIRLDCPPEVTIITLGA